MNAVHRSILCLSVLGLIASGCADDAGGPCSSDDDCGSGICGPDASCQDGEPGDPCDSDADCVYKPSSGDVAVCGDLDQCVAVECRFDADCGVDSCDEFGLCQALRCAGAATPCSLLPSFQCDDTQGCYSDGDCSGNASACYFYDGQISTCLGQDGCYYSGGQCNGVATGCYSYYSELSCEGQNYCYWTDSCAGVATSCSLLSLADCLSQPGCSLQ